jgi:hypothetical protein
VYSTGHISDRGIHLPDGALGYGGIFLKSAEHPDKSGEQKFLPKERRLTEKSIRSNPVAVALDSSVQPSIASFAIVLSGSASFVVVSRQVRLHKRCCD